MQIRSTDVVRHPVGEVFHTFRDRMPEIARHIKNVDRIVVEKREELPDGKVRLVNHWYAVGEIPAVARAFVKPDMLSWRDDATWDEAARSASWKLETFFFRDSVRCHGTTRFSEKGESATEVAIDATLEIRIGDLPMVPGLLRKKVSAEIERFIAALIGPNLRNATVGVQTFLDITAETRPVSPTKPTKAKSPGASAKRAAAKSSSPKAAPRTKRKT